MVLVFSDLQAVAGGKGRKSKMLKPYSQVQKLEEGKGKVEAVQSEQVQMRQRHQMKQRKMKGKSRNSDDGAIRRKKSRGYSIVKFRRRQNNGQDDFFIIGFFTHCP